MHDISPVKEVGDVKNLVLLVSISYFKVKDHFLYFDGSAKPILSGPSTIILPESLYFYLMSLIDLVGLWELA